MLCIRVLCIVYRVHIPTLYTCSMLNKYAKSLRMSLHTHTIFIFQRNCHPNITYKPFISGILNCCGCILVMFKACNQQCRFIFKTKVINFFCSIIMRHNNYNIFLRILYWSTRIGTHMLYTLIFIIIFESIKCYKLDNFFY